MFETSIRYLAAALSAYELSGQKHPILVTKAKQVADKMSVAWVGVSALMLNPVNMNLRFYPQSNTIPFGEVEFNSSTPQIATVSLVFVVSLDAGTLTPCISLISPKREL